MANPYRSLLLACRRLQRIARSPALARQRREDPYPGELVWLSEWSEQAEVVERYLAAHALRVAINWPTEVDRDPFFSAEDPRYCTAHTAAEVSRQLACLAELLFREEMQDQKGGRYAPDWESRYVSILSGAAEPLRMAKSFYFAACQILKTDFFAQASDPAGPRLAATADRDIWQDIIEQCESHMVQDASRRLFCQRRALVIMAGPLAAQAEAQSRGSGLAIASLPSPFGLPSPQKVEPAMDRAAQLIAQLQSQPAGSPAQDRRAKRQRKRTDQAALAAAKFHADWPKGLRGKKAAAVARGIDLRELKLAEGRSRRAHPAAVKAV